MGTPTRGKNASRSTCGHDSRDPGEILAELRINKPSRHKACGDNSGLRLADFAQQHAAGSQIGHHLGRQPRDHLIAPRSTGKGHPRLKTKLGLRRLQLGIRQVGRIGHDKVERGACERRESVGADPRDLQTQALGIGARNGQRRF